MLDNAIINYPGSKKKLLEYIYSSTYRYIDKNKYILDIFSGTGCVSQMYSNNGYKVISNDVEKYSYNISKALIGEYDKEIDMKFFNEKYLENKNKLIKYYSSLLNEEKQLLSAKSEKIIDLYENKILKVWDLSNENPYILNDISIFSIEDLNKNIEIIPFSLFSLYYSSSYFGLEQSIEIDSIRYAIEKTSKNNCILFSSLYYAMKECVFAKDGHMAQPLNFFKNFKKLLKCRTNNIYELFLKKVNEFLSDNYSFENKSRNKSFNVEATLLLEDSFIKDNVGFIYADPPYTDMQYSRYFHLLNTITEYRYPELTKKNGKITTGLYADNRFQSNLSSKSTAIKDLEKIIKFSSKNNINIAISYAYPKDLETQKSDRYTMNIEDLINCVKQYFSKVEILTENYLHSNNRNSDKKKVLEYLIIGYSQKKEEIQYNEANKVNNIKKHINEIIATNKNPLYDSMLYWSQKPFNVCDKIIEEFSQDNDVIMDPFMGSGVTIIESLNKKFERNAIGIDINDVPMFLCDSILKKYNIENINEKINPIKNQLLELNDNYMTDCSLCGNKGIIKKIIYDKEPEINLKEIYYCCNCSAKELLKVPDKNDIDNFHKKRNFEYLNNIKLLENSRIAVKKDEYIKDVFAERSFFILDKIYKIIEEVKEDEIKRFLKYVYASIIHKSKIVDKKMSSQWPLWIPKKDCLERNIVDIYIKSIEKMIDSLQYIKDNYYLDTKVSCYKELKNNNYLLFRKGVQNIVESEIPDKFVDLVITDPPYLGQVVYSEYMQLYKVFLNTEIDFENEIVISNAKNRNKDEKNYLELMFQAFKNINRMMKDKSYMFMYFHDSNLSIWNDLINILKRTNFVFISSMHIKKSKLTLKKIIDPKKTMNGEALLIFKKDDSNTWTNNNKNLNEIVNEIQEKAIEMINNSDTHSLTTSEIYDNGMLEYIIKNDYLGILSKKYKDLIDIFETFLDWDSEKMSWKLKIVQ